MSDGNILARLKKLIVELLEVEETQTVQDALNYIESKS